MRMAMKPGIIPLTRPTRIARTKPSAAIPGDRTRFGRSPFNTPTFFCSADAYDTLKTMVEKHGGIYLPKVGYDIEKVAQLFAAQLKKK